MERKTAQFRILVEDVVSKKETIVVVDKVVDCSGVWGNPNWSGIGGIPAVGELMLLKHGRLQQKIPDMSMEGRKYLGKCSMVIGSGASAITTINSLCQLAIGKPKTLESYRMKLMFLRGFRESKLFSACCMDSSR